MKVYRRIIDNCVYQDLIILEDIGEVFMFKKRIVQMFLIHTELHRFRKIDYDLVFETYNTAENINKNKVMLCLVIKRKFENGAGRKLTYDTLTKYYMNRLSLRKVVIQPTDRLIQSDDIDITKDFISQISFRDGMSKILYLELLRRGYVEP